MVYPPLHKVVIYIVPMGARRSSEAKSIRRDFGACEWYISRPATETREEWTAREKRGMRRNPTAANSNATHAECAHQTRTQFVVITRADVRNNKNSTTNIFK